MCCSCVGSRRDRVQDRELNVMCAWRCDTVTSSQTQWLVPHQGRHWARELVKCNSVCLALWNQCCVWRCEANVLLKDCRLIYMHQYWLYSIVHNVINCILFLQPWVYPTQLRTQSRRWQSKIPALAYVRWASFLWNWSDCPLIVFYCSLTSFSTESYGNPHVAIENIWV